MWASTQGVGDLGDPEWEQVDILAVGEVWNVIEDAIEEKCRAEDAAAPGRRCEGDDTSATAGGARCGGSAAGGSPCSWGALPTWQQPTMSAASSRI